jgi:hypothetical protein
MQRTYLRFMKKLLANWRVTYENWEFLLENGKKIGMMVEED